MIRNKRVEKIMEALEFGAEALIMRSKARVEKVYNQIMTDIKIDESLENNNAFNNFYACHGVYHTDFVVNLVEKILTSVGETEENIMLGKIAAKFHDIGCLQGKKNHAQRSYDMCREYIENTLLNKEEKDIILQAILDHSDGKNIKSSIGAALLIADKVHLCRERNTNYEKSDDPFGLSLLSINSVDVSILDKEIHVILETTGDYDLYSVNYWSKCVTIPQKAANFFGRECIWYIDNERIDMNLYLR